MNTESLILGVETATLGGSVCICRGRSVLARTVGEPDISHSHTLLTDIDRTLTEAGISLNDIELFAVAIGPGSFTGLRIGIATVKGFAATLQRPCAGIGTLEAVAHAAGPSQRSVALLPAGRGEVFAQMFSVGPDEKVIALDEAAHISPDRLFDRYVEFIDILWCGQAAHTHRDKLFEWGVNAGRQVIEARTNSERGWTLAPLEEFLAEDVSALALIKMQESQVEYAANLHAIYVRPSDAELNSQ